MVEPFKSRYQAFCGACKSKDDPGRGRIVWALDPDKHLFPVDYQPDPAGPWAAKRTTNGDVTVRPFKANLARGEYRVTRHTDTCIERRSGKDAPD